MGINFVPTPSAKTAKSPPTTTYPVRFAAKDRWCVLFQAIEHPAIYRWVEKLVAKINYTGQLSFDFVEQAGTLYALECNPALPMDCTSSLLLTACR